MGKKKPKTKVQKGEVSCLRTESDSENTNSPKERYGCGNRLFSLFLRLDFNSARLSGREERFQEAR